MKNKLSIPKLTIVATLGGLLFGYDTGVIAGTVGSLEVVFVENLSWSSEFLTNLFYGALVSGALIGCIIGGSIAGEIGRIFGRKKGLVLAGVLFLLSAIGSSFPEIPFSKLGVNTDQFALLFIFYRVIGGIGVGIASMLSPVYISEIAPASIRGKLVSYNQLAIVAGFMIVYFVNAGIGQSGDDTWLNEIGWRYMFLSELIPVILFLILLNYVPDTPRSLVLRDKDEEAYNVLLALNDKNEAKRVFDEIKNTLVEKSGALWSYGSLLIIVGIMLSVFQQFVGINVVLYYAPEIFKTVGFGTDAALWQTVIVGIVNFLFTIIAIKTVDSYGRKPLMIIGAIGMAIAMLSLGTSFYLEVGGLLALICMVVYVASFALSWGPVTWVLLSEIFPNNIRNKAMPIAVAAQWIANLVISVTFPIMAKSTYLTETFNNGFAYWIYGIMSVLAAIFVLKYVPETKGKTLEEMNKLWKK